MAWAVALDDEFAAWLKGQTRRVREEILTSVELLRAFGPQLGRPHVDRIEGSAYPNMKELRVQIGGDPWRVFFAFDPKRAAILLVGGDKTGDKRFYEVNIPIADARYARHLDELEAEAKKAKAAQKRKE